MASYKFLVFTSKDQCFIIASTQGNYPSISVFVSPTLSFLCFFSNYYALNSFPALPHCWLLGLPKSDKSLFPNSQHKSFMSIALTLGGKEQN